MSARADDVYLPPTTNKLLTFMKYIFRCSRACFFFKLVYNEYDNRMENVEITATELIISCFKSFFIVIEVFMLLHALLGIFFKWSVHEIGDTAHFSVVVLVNYVVRKYGNCMFAIATHTQHYSNVLKHIVNTMCKLKESIEDLTKQQLMYNDDLQSLQCFRIALLPLYFYYVLKNYFPGLEVFFFIVFEFVALAMQIYMQCLMAFYKTLNQHLMQRATARTVDCFRQLRATFKLLVRIRKLHIYTTKHMQWFIVVTHNTIFSCICNLHALLFCMLFKPAFDNKLAILSKQFMPTMVMQILHVFCFALTNERMALAKQRLADTLQRLNKCYSLHQLNAVAKQHRRNQRLLRQLNLEYSVFLISQYVSPINFQIVRGITVNRAYVGRFVVIVMSVAISGLQFGSPVTTLLKEDCKVL